MNIHKAKGIMIGRQVRELVKKSLLKTGKGHLHNGDIDLLDMIETRTAGDVERSERTKARQRMNRAAKHARTKDMFSDS
jgi:hypothetical protein